MQIGDSVLCFNASNIPSIFQEIPCETHIYKIRDVFEYCNDDGQNHMGILLHGVNNPKRLVPPLNRRAREIGFNANRFLLLSKPDINCKA